MIDQFRRDAERRRARLNKDISPSTTPVKANTPRKKAVKKKSKKKKTSKKRKEPSNVGPEIIESPTSSESMIGLSYSVSEESKSKMSIKLSKMGSSEHIDFASSAARSRKTKLKLSMKGKKLKHTASRGELNEQSDATDPYLTRKKGKLPQTNKFGATSKRKRDSSVEGTFSVTARYRTQQYAAEFARTQTLDMAHVWTAMGDQVSWIPEAENLIHGK